MEDKISPGDFKKPIDSQSGLNNLGLILPVSEMS